MKRLSAILDSEKGTGFSPYINPANNLRALAPEGRFSEISLALPHLAVGESMKNSILRLSFILLTAIFLLNSVPCHSQDSMQYRTQESAQYRACMEKAYAQMSMNICADAEYKRVDSEMNGVYQRLLSKAEKVPGATVKIKAAERAWILYRDAYMEALYPAEDKQLAYGSIYPMEYAEFRTALTREHTNALRDLIKQYDEEGQ
jgi:uncharacterized protein YecT (DUF1311 family)